MKRSNISRAALFTCFLIAGIMAGHSQTITPTQTDEIIIDNSVPGKADPGDRIRYKVTIQNTGATSGNGTQLNIVPDPRTTFVPGTFRSSPLAVPDAYACTGNVGLVVPAASGLLVNDFDDNTAGLTVTAGTFATTGGGSITIAADGSFMYSPPAGLTGGMTDTYNYTLNDGNGVGAGVPATDLGLVTFTLNNLIWFVDNTGGGSGGNGTLANPFKTLADFNAGSTVAADVVYLEYSGTNYTGGIVLANNERLFGEGHTGSANLANVLPFSLAPNSKALPAINGMRPVITNTAGDGILLASNNIIQGLNIGNTSDYAIDDNGNVGNLAISEVDINTSGGGIRADAGGVLAVTLGSLVTTGGHQGITIFNTSGTFTVTGATNISNTAVMGIHFQNNSTNISFNAITVGNTGHNGILLSGQTGTFGVSGLTTINALPSGNPSIGITTCSGAISFSDIDINGRKTIGIYIQGGTSTITAGTINVDNTLASTSPAVNISTIAGGSVAFGASTINGGGAVCNGIDLSSNAGAVSFGAGSSITGANDRAFSVAGGSANVTYNGTINNTGGNAVYISTRTGGTVTLQGNITHNAAVTAITALNNSSGSTINFNGASIGVTSTTATGVNLSSNTGATINFTGGGLVISTTSGSGFLATGGGTVSVQGSGNSIGSSAAKAIELSSVSANTTFSTITSAGTTTEGINLLNLSSGSTFKVTGAVNITMAATGNANVNISNCPSATIDIGMNVSTPAAVNLNSRRSSGIILNNSSGPIRFGNVTANNPNSMTVPAIKSTGCAGVISFAKTDIDMNNAGGNEGFTNAETPQDNSGDGDAIYVSGFTGTAFSITGGTIQKSGDDGIDFRASANLTLINVTIIDVGKSPGATCVDCNSSGVQAYNATGLTSISNCVFERGRLRNFYFSNASGSGTLNITNSLFNDTRSQGSPATDNLQVYGTGTATLSVDIENSTFTRSSTKQIDVVFKGNAVLTKCDITGSTLDYVDGPSSGIFIEGFDNAQVNFNIMDNPKLHSQDEGLVTISAANASSVQGRIKNNSNMKFYTPSMGGSIFGIVRVLSDGSSSVATVLIENNSMVLDNGTDGINLSIQLAGAAKINATLNGNTIHAMGVAGIPLDAINAFVNPTVGGTKQLCLTFNNNTVTGNWQRAARVRALSPTGVTVTNFVTDVATTWTNNGNTGGPVVQSTSAGGTITAAPMACAVPNNPLP